MRRQNDARQNRANTSNTNSSWFRIGVLSATVLTPLIARWNDLRTSNSAQSLREVATARLSDARDQAVVRLVPVREMANTRLGSARELATARLGDARGVASARFDDALERLAQVRTPDLLQNVPPFSLARRRAEELQRQRQRRQRQTTILWLAGVGVGLAAAGVTAFVVARRRIAATIEDDEPMVELPLERNLAEAMVGTPPAMRNSYTATAERAEISVPMQSFAAGGAAGAASQAEYVGNMHTMIFHEASDVNHLPNEENRIYFTSEVEARQAGYRRARETEQQPSENENS